MGKRKERRLAAMSAAGRRVKLDLFAEPSGEMVDKTSNDEIRGDPVQDHYAGVPISPSASGQNQENPLLLLGQYSDDEVNDDEKIEPKIEMEGNTHPDVTQEGVHADVGENEGCQTDQNIDVDNMKQDVDELDATTNNDNGKNIGESGIPFETGLNEADSVTEACSSAASAMQIIGDASDGWKIVMHEETSQYYYWNTLTGETSWEVPDALSHRMETTGDQKASLGIEDRIDALSHSHASIPQLNTGSIGYVNVTAVQNGNDHLITNVTDTTNGFIVGKENGVSGNIAFDTSQVAVHYSSTGGSILYPEVLAQHSFASLAQSSALSEHLTNSRDAASIISSGEVNDKHLMLANNNCEAPEDHSVRLVKYGESLLQRLKTLKGSNESIQVHDWALKCILEVETRLSDCKALSSYGSSLLPFWWYTETQLKRIESIIEQEGSVVHDSKNYNEEVDLSSSRKSVNSLDSGKGHVLSMKDNISFNAVDASHSDASLSKDVTKETTHASKTEDAVGIKRSLSEVLEMETVEETAQNISIPQPSGGSPEVQAKEEARVDPVSVLQLSGSDLEVQDQNQADKTLASPEIESYVVEDVDMDVEMEVDEETPTDQPASGNLFHLQCPEPVEQPVIDQCVSPQSIPSGSSHEVNVPPPPEEEWIPPPPPEDEAIPPPPPEDPPTQSIPPPPYSENASFSYPEQYNMAYPVSAFEYYAPSISEAPSTTYYANAEVSHIVEPQPSPYYDPVTANSFTEANPDANSAEPVVYYDVPIETVLPLPVTTSLETSGFYVQPASTSYNGDISTSEHSGSVMISLEYTGSSLPTLNAESDLSSAVQKPGEVMEPGASVSITSQSIGAALMNGTSSDAISTANVKNQPKVVRSKKRTISVSPSLRSNKKVSSLVDKWKAAKEELHGDEEDEPENAYEVLEKKRQKEIEEWKARQISSGEAQDNANFLPLGGDWRERVKRRRAETNAPSIQTPPEEATKEKKQPNLVELPKDLPSGWQAYWDESSREIYYGNAMTSETTWIRPSR
uniref:Formin-binding protein 4 n=2 Tax=Anthurium amnicola TaxID=1678845 RepID=A0A1D1YYL9_9ARAE